MNKVLVASLLALGLVAADGQRASAWSEFKFSAGVSLCWTRSGSNGSWGFYSNREAIPYPGCLTAGCAAPGYFGSYAAAPGYDAYAGYAAQAPAAQTAAPYAANPYYNSGYQPVGYYYSGYSANAVPAYWYGR